MADLLSRQEMGRACLRVLRQAERAGEEGATEAIARYSEQLRVITDEIRRRRREEREALGAEKPPTVTIGLRAARLGAKVRGGQ